MGMADDVGTPVCLCCVVRGVPRSPVLAGRIEACRWWEAVS
jgi:hypothetical protein